MGAGFALIYEKISANLQQNAQSDATNGVRTDTYLNNAVLIPNWIRLEFTAS